MSVLLPAFLWFPVLMAGLTLATRGHRPLQRALALGAHAAMLIAAIAGLVATADGKVLSEQLGGWPGGIAIPFAMDAFAALLVTVAALMVLVCSTFAVGTRDDHDPYFHVLVLVLSGGVYGAFLTGDLFNLFVMIEVALIPSYVLLTRSGRAPQLMAGRVYFTVNLLVSTVLLIGIALVYATAGTVNLGELAGAAQESTAVALAGGVVLLALAAKAALVPMHSWLPRSYPYASVAVTALLSGLLTKIGVYGIFRLYAVLYGGDAGLHNLWLVVLLVTMVVGVLGALGESSMRSILAFHMTSQVGYILLGIAFFGPLALTAGIFYLVHHIIVKASLFLSTGAVEHYERTGKLSQLGGMMRREPWLGVVFLAGAFALVGVPPFSGFIAKLTLIRAAVDAGVYVAACVAIGVGLFTLLSMLKIWNGAFWGAKPDPDYVREVVPAGAPPAEDLTDPSAARLRTSLRPQSRVGRMPRRLIVPGAVLAALSLLIGLSATVLLDLAGTAAAGLVDPTAYIEAVTG